jgi:hypothetical protein
VSNYLVYVVIGIVVVSFIAIRGIPFIQGAIRFCKSMFSKIYIDRKSDLSPEQYRKIALGALYSEQKGAYLNSLRTGIEKSYIRKLLSEAWDADDRDEAVETLRYLQTKGYRFYFPAVAKSLGLPEEEQKTIIIESFDNDDDRQQAYSLLCSLTEALPELKEAGIIAADGDVAKYGAAGWDCGRLVFLSRLCRDVGYIADDEAWKAIDTAAEFSKKLFSSWRDYANSYIIGRAMWGGAGAYNGTIIDIAAYLLAEPKSPWTQLPW